MSKQLGKHFLKLLFRRKKTLGRKYRELITAFCVAVCILVLRSFGLLQSLEWAALDQFFRLRPDEAPQNHITIVAIDEVSLRQVNSWPISDQAIAEMLEKLKVHKPRAIGLDIYRDLPVEPGHSNLVEAYKSTPNLVGIELLGPNKNTIVSAPRELSDRHQVGFNNVVLDGDGKIRRSLLYWHDVDRKSHQSFALKLALLYLKNEGITPKKAASNHNYLQLGKAVFHRFQPNHGAYIKADGRGYQILSNFPKPACNNLQVESCPFRQVSLIDVLANRVRKDWISDSIVLIGSTAPSLPDDVLIPYSSRLMGTVQPVAGIELQAYFISELIAAALEGRPLLKVWSDEIEWLWIFAWAYLGVATRRRIQHPCISGLSIVFCCLLLTGYAYVTFLDGWWIPILPGLLTFCSSAVVLTYQLAHMQEELKRSKDFLGQVINTIPDPIFVKNEKHQWIVLNQAYCQFIGYPKTMLIEKSDYDFFPKHEADVFRRQDNLVLSSQQPQENEEEFTDAVGKTYLIATKRSLHKDAAGNLYLVGVIRDITQRKLKEEQLKDTAAKLTQSNTELSQSNDELKRKEDQMRYLAYHDSLTGLPNRKSFAEQLHESLEWAQSNNLLLALLFIDLDGFKQVNDTLGHEIGDRVLVAIAHRLNNSLRGTDTISRLGGDEFTVILRTIPNIKVAARVAEKILTTINEPIVFDKYTIRVSASIGISIYPINSHNYETLLKEADNAMYRAKHLGKNRYEFA
ncbi:CHASE2 domain-containing protein [Scytonema hofmannii FACHB-248]|uniref:CHASE2 domain-containing protein n=1 Tax=Scytonema hofmannii FACHB-248 TaxID=1842502 RepID=A0ABR8GJI1_9CYAN|nr:MULTISPECIES: CHASE2 domain-containing protein [Nostocales]MBD2603325.1 CHASE2 domain-containing protein [Scytonema hofmannii FACHB-248]